MWLLCLSIAVEAGAEQPTLTKLSISVRGNPCSALLLRPPPFMESISAALARAGIATLRFNFPYAEAKRARIDGKPLLAETIRAAAREAEKRRGSLPLWLGGKSIGGLVAAEVLQSARAPAAVGLVILGYPLHPPGRPSGVNAGALRGLEKPLLVLQGTLDPLADLVLLSALIEGLGPQAQLVTVPDADHAFALPEGSARTQEQVYEEMAGDVASFVATLAPQPGG